MTREKTTPKYFPEVRECAVRLALKHRGEYSSQLAVIETNASKIGCSAQPLHEWVKRQEIDSDLREDVSREEHDRVKALEHGVKELRHTTRQDKPTPRCARAQPDETGMPEIQRVWQASLGVYGAERLAKTIHRLYKGRADPPSRILEDQGGGGTGHNGMGGLVQALPPVGNP